MEEPKQEAGKQALQFLKENYWLLIMGLFLLGGIYLILPSRPVSPTETPQAQPAPAPAPDRAVPQNEDQHMIIVEIAAISQIREQGSAWDAPGNILMNSRGAEVRLGDLRHASEIELSLDNNDQYRIDFLAGGKTLQKSYLEVHVLPSPGGLFVHRMKAPAREFDALRILPVAGDNRYSLGHIRLIE
jgi:hypothetical protein